MKPKLFFLKSILNMQPEEEKVTEKPSELDDLGFPEADDETSPEGTFYTVSFVLYVIFCPFFVVYCNQHVLFF